MISGYFQVFCFAKVLVASWISSFVFIVLATILHFAKFVSSMRLHTFVSELCGDFYKRLIFVHIFLILTSTGSLARLSSDFQLPEPEVRIKIWANQISKV